MKAGGKGGEVPRPLRQLLRRLPVGRSTVYLNELHPHTQQLFLKECMEAEDQRRRGCANAVRGVRALREDVNMHPAARFARMSETEASQQSGDTQRCTSVPVLDHMESVLDLPQGSSGQLDAYRAPHPPLLGKPHLFLLALPRGMLERRERHGVCRQRSVEAVLQEHLVHVNRTLYWRQAAPQLIKANCAVGDAPDVMLQAIWGCTIPQARQAAEVAAAHGYRAFLLGYARQPLLLNGGLTVRELGNWCPNAFRSFLLDVRSVERPKSSLCTTERLQLLEEAQRGFFTISEDERNDIHTDGGSTSNSKNNNSGPVQSSGKEASQAECASPFAVAELIVDAKRDALVQWSQVRDNPLTARLFEALYDRRHFCVADAVLHASLRVVLPFLLGEVVSPPTGVSGSSGEDDVAPLTKLLRWSELHTLLRWHYFEPVFGSLSRIARAEEIAAVGGGADPYILPLHDAFVARFLLPRMREYYHRNNPCSSSSSSREVLAATQNRGAAALTPPTGTVGVLDCFNSMVSERYGGGGETTAEGRASVSENGEGLIDDGCSTRVYHVYFTFEDLPSLVKYLLYFDQHFVIASSGTNVTFSLA